ncbi:VanZ family protein [Vagococcus sp.]|uniref:VanZ family protein n=1 Tax=Vagococcus sp. TaxID=1933889 RepID=UPI003F966D86
MKKIKKNGNIYLFIALIIMVILFISSSQTYEQQSTVPILQRLLKNEPFKLFLSQFEFHYAGNPISVAEKGYFYFVEFFIRKGAHFFTFFILGGSLFLLLFNRTKSYFISFLTAWMSATGYATLDEGHQMLTGGRSPLFQDVVLDSIGALTACVLACFILWWQTSRKKTKR